MIRLKQTSSPTAGEQKRGGQLHQKTQTSRRRCSRRSRAWMRHRIPQRPASRRWRASAGDVLRPGRRSTRNLPVNRALNQSRRRTHLVRRFCVIGFESSVGTQLTRTMGGMSRGVRERSRPCTGHERDRNDDRREESVGDHWRCPKQRYLMR